MSKQLMEIVLPRLARPLHDHLERFRQGQLTERQFTRQFEKELQRQHRWLAKHGVAAGKAAIAIHGAVIVLSLAGLRAESHDTKVPLEILENRAVREAALDVSQTYGVERLRAADAIARIIARYGE